MSAEIQRILLRKHDELAKHSQQCCRPVFFSANKPELHQLTTNKLFSLSFQENENVFLDEIFVEKPWACKIDETNCNSIFVSVYPDILYTRQPKRKLR